MNKPLRILIVEDSEEDALLVVCKFKQAGYDVSFELVQTEAAMEAALAREKWDIIISDYVLPDFSGIAALKLLQRMGMDIPFIVVSGKIGEDVAVEAIKSGANDYLMKSNLKRLAVSAEREMHEADNRRERKQAEEALRESDRRFLDVMHASRDAILLIDGNMFVDCNEATALMLGYPTRKEFLMVHPSKLSPDIQPDGRKSFEKAEEMMKIAMEKGYNRFEWMHRKAGGEDFLVEVSLTPISLHGKTVIHCLWRDLTESKKIETAERGHLKELEVFYNAAMGREERIIELKKEVERLKLRLGDKDKA